MSYETRQIHKSRRQVDLKAIKKANQELIRRAIKELKWYKHVQIAFLVLTGWLMTKTKSLKYKFLLFRIRRQWFTR